MLQSDCHSLPPPYCYLDLFLVVLSSTPRLRCVNSQLVSIPPVGILNSLCSIFNIWLFIYSVPNYYNTAKYTPHLNSDFFFLDLKIKVFCMVAVAIVFDLDFGCYLHSAKTIKIKLY